MTTTNKDLLLDQVVHRLPGLMFKVLSLMEGPRTPDIPEEAPLHWCICTNCRDMSTDVERLCCHQTPQNCISNMAYTQFYVLDEGPTQLGMTSLQSVMMRNLELSSDSTGMTYRQFVLWQHGWVGEGNRAVIPSCCVWKIRDTFPDPRGQYTGFRVHWLM